ncbi:hypothetical protein B14911_27755 [Bacillus sp. NRRL B-14911]|nr:hypothetical protein B14911_27755 [Bacillus sp. NRRL B-14911]
MIISNNSIGMIAGKRFITDYASQPVIYKSYERKGGLMIIFIL